MKTFTQESLLNQLVQDMVTVAISGAFPTELVPGQCTPEAARRELAAHLKEYGQNWIAGLHENLLSKPVVFHTATPDEYDDGVGSPPIPTYNEMMRRRGEES